MKTIPFLAHHQPGVPAAEFATWHHQDLAHEIVDLLAEYGVSADYDERTAGNSGPSGEDWGSLRIETRHGSIEAAPHDCVAIHPAHRGGPARIELLTSEEVVAYYVRQ